MWFEFWLSIATAVAILFVVGFPIAVAVGLRGFAAVALTAPIAVSVVAGSAVIAGFLNVPWSLVPVIVIVLVAVVILVPLTRRFGESLRAVSGAWPWLGVGIGAILLGVQVVRVFVEPGTISQTFDNVFHLNAVRYVLDTGDASSLSIGLLTSPSGSLGFYPAAWHGVVSLVAQISGVSIPIAVQAVTFVTAALIWPLGAVLLVRTVVGPSAVALVGTGVVAAAMPVFPLLLMDYGVLYPYQLGLAMLPATLAVTAWLARIGFLRIGRPWQTIALTLVLLGGMSLAHPGAFVSWLALTFPFAVTLFVRFWRGSALRKRTYTVLGAMAYLAIGVLLLKVLRPPVEARQWPTSKTIPQAIGDVVFGSAWYGVPAVLVSLLVLIGVVAAIIRRTETALVTLAMFLVVAVLYIIVCALTIWIIRDAATGSWYNNPPRLAAMLAIGAVPVAGLGLAGLGEAVRTLQLPRAVGLLASAAALALGIALTQFGPFSPVPTAVSTAAIWYQPGDDAALLDTDENTLLERIDDEVPEDSLIAGNPWTGAALAYAISGRHVLMPHMLMEETPELQSVNEHLRDATAGSEVCDAIDELQVDYVLDFGENGVHANTPIYEGLTDLEDSAAVDLVDSQGDARLYRIIACGR